MSKYEVYPAYKDSGVEWLGEMPEHWESSSLKYNISNLDYKRIPLSSSEREHMQGKYPYYGASGIIDYVNDYIFSETTILIGEDGANLLAKSTELAFIAKEKYWVNNHAHILKPLDGLFEFWMYALNNIDFTPFISGSAQPKLTAEALSNIQIPYPEIIEERKAIANFLDRETTKIDTLIEKQQELIELLKEKRQAVISHAVTKGLDPNVKMKDSGVEWLGEVPEHWIPSSLKHLAKIMLGKMLTPNDKGGMILKPYLRAKNIQWLTVQTDDVNKMWFDLVELKNLRLKKDDLLVSEGGEVGRTCIWSDELEECYIQNSVNRVRITDGNPRFYLYQFYAAGHYGYFDSIVNRISIAHLTKEKLSDSLFAKAPVAEQIAIANHLDAETAKFDTLIEKSNQAITLLKERRSALISAAVTGKIDVRGEK